MRVKKVWDRADGSNEKCKRFGRSCSCKSPGRVKSATVDKLKRACKRREKRRKDRGGSDWVPSIVREGLFGVWTM